MVTVTAPRRIRLLEGSTRRMVGAVLVGALATACSVALMAVSAYLIARAAQQPPVMYLMVATVAVRTFGIGRAVLRWVERVLSHDTAFRLLGRLRERILTKLAELAPTGLPFWRRGDLMSRLLADVDDVGEWYLRVVLPIAGSVIVSGGAIVLLTVLLPAAGLALAGALVVAMVIGPLLDARRAGRAERDWVAARSDRAELVGRMVDDLTDLSIRGATAGALADLAVIETRGRRAQLASARSAGLAAGLAVLAMGAAVLLSIVVGTDAVIAGDLHPVALAVIAMTPLAMSDLVQAVGVAAATARRSSSASRRIRELLATGPTTAPGPVDPAPLQVSAPVIELHGVSARWPGADRDVLTGFDLTLRPGETVLVSGSSGAGKSTLIALLLGFLTPTAGRITVDGRDAADIDPEQWRAMFGWCEQQAYLFDSTVAENVRLARPDATDDQVAAAVRAAGAGDWLDRLPRGLDTQVGEHGSAVSGGERQRLSLARALLSGRPVLLADEPAAHLDPATADAVTRAVLAAAPTVLLVSHRPGDEALVDRVVRLD